MNAVSFNAKMLLEDAANLYALERYPSATSLAILSIEESGKIAVLRQLARACDGKEVKEAWKAFRTHTKKNALWMLPSLAKQSARKMEDFLCLHVKDSSHTFELDALKQVGFYTDCLGKAHWSQPAEVIGKDVAEYILKTAKVLCPKKEFTKREVELRVKYLKPAPKDSMFAQKQALKFWFEAMLSEGLVEEGAIKFADFIDLN